MGHKPSEAYFRPQEWKLDKDVPFKISKSGEGKPIIEIDFVGMPELEPDPTSTPVISSEFRDIAKRLSLARQEDSRHDFLAESYWRAQNLAGKRLLADIRFLGTVKAKEKWGSFVPLAKYAGKWLDDPGEVDFVRYATFVIANERKDRLPKNVCPADWPVIKIGTDRRPVGKDGQPIPVEVHFDAESMTYTEALASSTVCLHDDLADDERMKLMRTSAEEFVLALELFAELCDKWETKELRVDPLAAAKNADLERRRALEAEIAARDREQQRENKFVAAYRRIYVSVGPPVQPAPIEQWVANLSEYCKKNHRVGLRLVRKGCGAPARCNARTKNGTRIVAERRFM